MKTLNKKKSLIIISTVMLLLFSLTINAYAVTKIKIGIEEVSPEEARAMGYKDNGDNTWVRESPAGTEVAPVIKTFTGNEAQDTHSSDGSNNSSGSGTTTTDKGGTPGARIPVETPGKPGYKDPDKVIPGEDPTRDRVPTTEIYYKHVDPKPGEGLGDFLGDRLGAKNKIVIRGWEIVEKPGTDDEEIIGWTYPDEDGDVFYLTELPETWETEKRIINTSDSRNLYTIDGVIVQYHWLIKNLSDSSISSWRGITDRPSVTRAFKYTGVYEITMIPEREYIVGYDETYVRITIEDGEEVEETFVEFIEVRRYTDLDTSLTQRWELTIPYKDIGHAIEIPKDINNTKVKTKVRLIY